MTREQVFAKYKKSHNIFIETGTHYGDSINEALNLGFKKNHFSRDIK